MQVRRGWRSLRLLLRLKRNAGSSWQGRTEYILCGGRSLRLANASSRQARSRRRDHERRCGREQNLRLCLRRRRPTPPRGRCGLARRGAGFLRVGVAQSVRERLPGAGGRSRASKVARALSRQGCGLHGGGDAGRWRRHTQLEARRAPQFRWLLPVSYLCESCCISST